MNKNNELQNIMEEEEEDDHATVRKKMSRAQSTALSRKSKKSILVSTTSGDSNLLNYNQCSQKLYRIQNTNTYMVIYFIMYYWLALNDQFRLIFIPKSGDVAFFVFTLLFILIFIFDIIARSYSEKGYFLKFFFLVDIFSIIVIIFSSIVNDISLFITLSFLKIIMIVRVTDVVMNYKAWNRKRLMKKVMMIKKQRKTASKAQKHDKAYQLKHGLLRKPTNILLSRPAETLNSGTDNVSKKSQRISRYSNVNISMLNNMRSNATTQDEEIDQELTKQTRLEKRVSMLTIKRTMTVFFGIVFSVPFFISTTYKSWLSEFVPIAKMVRQIEADQVAYMSTLQFIVDEHKDDFDALVRLKAPGFNYESKDYANDDIRQLDLVEVEESEITFTVNLRKTVRLYSICGICGYSISGVCLIGFVIYINRDLDKYVIHPLESMYEKVTILSKDPMSATKDDFASKAGVVSLLQSKSKSQTDEIHLIDKSITKIAYLLAVGYGEAGTNIIINNMGKSKGLDIDIPGEKVIGIYGFCDIRNFTDATEVLQTEVMTFVNSIAAIVHINIVKFGGSNNKNIGDAFLFVWKVASYTESPAFAYRLQDYMLKKGELNEEEKNVIAMIGDLAVYCIMKCI